MNAASTTLSLSAAGRLRAQHYNGVVLKRIDLHDDLAIFRVRPDFGISPFAGGQYTTLGLGAWEPRLPGCDPEPADRPPEQLIRRVYSISCSMLDDWGTLRRPDDFPYLEFYIALVRHAEGAPPALTPRLFTLSAGDRLFLGTKVSGRYTLEGVEPDHDVVFVATGTGEAPHNAMVAELLTRGHRGRIASVTCVRYRRDLAYAAAHAALMERYPQYRYLSLTTREAENQGAKRYLQDYFASGDFERETGIEIAPGKVHAFLCGNPAMIGLGTGGAERPGMLQWLEARGLRPEEHGRPGEIHFEKYW